MSSTHFVVVLWLLAKLWRVVLSDSHDDVAAGGGEFELRDQLAGAVPDRHLPANRRQTEESDTDWHNKPAEDTYKERHTYSTLTQRHLPAQFLLHVSYTHTEFPTSQSLTVEAQTHKWFISAVFLNLIWISTTTWRKGCYTYWGVMWMRGAQNVISCKDCMCDSYFHKYYTMRKIFRLIFSKKWICTSSNWFPCTEVDRLPRVIRLGTLAV